MGQLEKRVPRSRMTSPKLLLVLMAAAAYAAPQINERQVVGQVLTQLTPAIQQAIASLNSGSVSRSVSVPSSRFSGDTGFTSSSGLGSSRLSSSRFSGGGSSRFSGATGSSGFSSGSRRSGASVSTITSSVVSQLQPSIAAAVAQALAGSRRSSSVSLGRANKEQEYADGPAEYNFEYKVADDEQQNYIARQESRDGDTVTGSYNYVNPAGTLVTVNYEAGPEGFKQETSEQKGAVEMRNIPVGWDGPLAGVDDQAVSSGVSASRSTSTSQSDLIAKILASLQPMITSLSPRISSAVSCSGWFHQEELRLQPWLSEDPNRQLWSLWSLWSLRPVQRQPGDPRVRRPVQQLRRAQRRRHQARTRQVTNSCHIIRS